MFGIIRSALNYLMGWIFRTVTIKFGFFTALVLAISSLGSMALNFTTAVNFAGIGSLFGALPDGLLYFCGLFRLEVGIPMILAAYAARFFIRRLPVIG